jgi:YidC/Oxa1 family membrane protein insertase
MSTEKRLVLFLILSFASVWATQQLLVRIGWLPPAPKRAAVVQGKDQAKPQPAEAPPAIARAAAARPEAEPNAAPEAGAEAEPATIDEVPAGELVLGSVADKDPNGYRLEVRLAQRGAGVAQVLSSRWEAEHLPGRPRNRPLELIRRDEKAPPSFALDVAREADPGADAPKVELDDRLWQVVTDEQGRVRTAATRSAPRAGAATEGQQITLRTEIDEPFRLVVTRTYRLFPGEDGFELELRFTNPGTAEVISYELLGPHGIPIEGEWYTGTFRDVFFGGVEGTTTKVHTVAAYGLAKNPDQPERYTSLPLRFAGVENQYFAVFLEPVPIPAGPEQSRIDEARTVVIRADSKDLQKSDVSVELISKPIPLAEGGTVAHTYRVFAGPKMADELGRFQATELASYRKGWWLPVIGDLGASFMARRVITPMLTVIHGATEAITRSVGGTRGSWGIAIILLTISVRLILFPLSRKQARMAQRMQELQPHLAKLKEECGDDKERFAREQFALFRQYGVNPMGGCLPALIQLPVLIGLWQALNNSVALRHSSFLWIQNLAAPDMLFRFPFRMEDVPLIGWAIGPYFNLLPILVVALMLVQTKLFSPPPTTPEAEQQQAMMKYMMIFMAFMFYKVPSGLGIYFITSSLWQIGERLLLPKGGPLKPVAAKESAARPARAAGDGAAGRAAKPQPAAPGKGGWWQQFREQTQARFEQILEEAEKQKSARREDDSRGRDRPRPRPGRKR